MKLCLSLIDIVLGYMGSIEKKEKDYRIEVPKKIYNKLYYSAFRFNTYDIKPSRK